VTPERKALWQMHGCVLLWGFTAILGKAITLPAAQLVWWRMGIVTAVLACWPPFWRALRAMPTRTIGIFAGIGVIVALHWLTFYGAIKLSNASVTATCMAVTPVFIALLEPWITGQRFDRRELAIGIAVVPGVALVIGGTPAGMRLGIAIGVLSALLVAVFAALNKRYVTAGAPLVVTGIELAAGAAFMGLVALAWPGGDGTLALPDARDGLLLLILALACTLLPFAVSLQALRHLNAFTANLIVSLEPIYAIALAILIFGEQRELGLPFYLGVAIILGAVLLHTRRQRR
jgi:drug/metabolite transporter (DMT)-like permease